MLCLAAGAMLAEDPAYLPQVHHGGRNCYYYTAEKGESVPGIATRFGWNPDTLMALNPEAADVKKGMVLYYPVVTHTKAAPAAPASASASAPAAATAQGASAPAASAPAFASTPAASPSPESPAPPFSGVKPPKSASAPAAGQPQPAPGFSLAALPVKDYTVQQGDSYTSIARLQHTSVRQILKDNPGATPDNLKPGAVLRVRPGSEMESAQLRDVPEKTRTGQKTYKVKKNDSWASIATKNSMQISTLQAANPQVTDLQKGQKIVIPQLKDTVVARWLPVVDPEEETPGGIARIYNSVHQAPSQDYTITLLIDNEGEDYRREKEFLRGFLLGMQGLVREPNHVKINVLEVTTYAELDKLIAEGALKGSSMVISPIDRGYPAELADYCEQQGITFLNVFDAKTDVSRYPHGVQLLPETDYFYSRTSDFLTRVLGDRKFLFVGDAATDPDNLGAYILARLEKSGTANYDFLPDEESLALYEYNPTKSYAVVSSANTQADLKKTFEALSGIVDKYPNMPLTLIGRPNWLPYTGLLEKEMQKLDTYIPSRFIVDQEGTAYKNLVADFKKFYKAAPINSLPHYAATGYDVARYFVAQWLKHRGDLNYADEAEGMVQLDYRPERESLQGGLVNHCVYLLHFTPFKTVDKIGL